jgi:beta-glucosidase
MERRPEALGAAVAYTAEVLPGVPLLVTENGIATADDEDRIRFTGDALRGLSAAIAGGADVRGGMVGAPTVVRSRGDRDR